MQRGRPRDVSAGVKDGRVTSLRLSFGFSDDLISLDANLFVHPVKIYFIYIYIYVYIFFERIRSYTLKLFNPILRQIHFAE